MTDEVTRRLADKITRRVKQTGMAPELALLTYDEAWRGGWLKGSELDRIRPTPGERSGKVPQVIESGESREEAGRSPLKLATDMARERKLPWQGFGPYAHVERDGIAAFRGSATGYAYFADTVTARMWQTTAPGSSRITNRRLREVIAVERAWLYGALRTHMGAGWIARHEGRASWGQPDEDPKSEEEKQVGATKPVPIQAPSAPARRWEAQVTESTKLVNEKKRMEFAEYDVAQALRAYTTDARGDSPIPAAALDIKLSLTNDGRLRMTWSEEREETTR